MLQTYINDLTSVNSSLVLYAGPNVNNTLDLDAINSAFGAVHAYSASWRSGDIGATLTATFTMAPGDPLLDLEPGNQVVAYLHRIYRVMRITDVARTVDASSGYTLELTMKEGIADRSERRPILPVKYMSLPQIDYEAMLYEMQYSGSTLDYVGLLKLDNGGNRRGWRYSQILKSLAKYMGFALSYSASFDYWVKEFTVNDTFFRAFQELTEKYGFETVYTPYDPLYINSGSFIGRLLVIDTVSARRSGLMAPYFTAASSITEDRSYLRIPSSIKFFGGKTYFDKRYNKSVQHYGSDTLDKDDIYLGDYMDDLNSGADPLFVYANASYPPGGTTKADRYLILKDWIQGYATAGEGGKPYAETTVIDETVERMNPEQLATMFDGTGTKVTFENPEADTRATTADDQTVLVNFKTRTRERYVRDFFGELGPIVHKQVVSYVDSIMYNDNTADPDNLDVDYVTRYEEEAYNYGGTMHPIFQAPRYHSPILDSDLNVILGGALETAFQTLSRSAFNAFTQDNVTDTEFSRRVGGKHMPYYVRIVYETLPTRDFPSGTVVTSEADAQRKNPEIRKKLLPSLVELRFIRYATGDEDAYAEGDVIYEATIVYAPVVADIDGNVFVLAEMKEKDAAEEILNLQFCPFAWGKYDEMDDQAWYKLLRPDCVIEDTVVAYTPVPGRHAYMKSVVSTKIGSGGKKQDSTCSVETGSIPNQSLKLREMDVEQEIEVAGSTVYTGENGVCYTDNPPMEVSDPMVHDMEDARRITRRLKEQFSSMPITRNYSFDSLIPVGCGWSMRLPAIHVPAYPDHWIGTFSSTVGGTLMIPGTAEKGIITSFDIRHDASGATTSFTCESTEPVY